MYFHPLIVLSLGAALAGLEGDADAPSLQFDSYTRAWHAAAEVHRPMLVILNPATEQVSASEPISVEKLRDKEEFARLLDSYVIAEIDTGTEHGRRVHELFGSKPLPRVIVIDKQQKTQVFRTSSPLPDAELKKVLERYQQGTTVSTAPGDVNWSQPFQTPGYCPNCQRF
jgi:hypothetical protein